MKAGKNISEEEREFYESSIILVDKLTVQIQLDAIYNKALKILENRFGNIIPKQNADQLRELFINAIDDLYEKKA